MSLSLFTIGNNKRARTVDPFFRDDWLVFDPFQEELASGHQPTLAGRQVSKQVSPLLTTDIVETETEFKVLADLPGVKPEDLELTVEGTMLIMKAERKQTHDVTTDKYHMIERSYGNVQRKINLGKSADMAKATTTYKDGVITVTIPKLVQRSPVVTKLTVNCE